MLFQYLFLLHLNFPFNLRLQSQLPAHVYVTESAYTGYSFASFRAVLPELPVEVVRLCQGQVVYPSTSPSLQT
jgi:hypothetical protein